MNFWEMFVLNQASSALHTIVRRYAGKYFTAEETAALDVVLDALTELPARIHPPAMEPAPSAAQRLSKK